METTITNKELTYRIDLLLRVGRALTESLADTARVLRTIYRIASFLQIPREKLHILVNYSMLQINYYDEDRSDQNGMPYSITRFARCTKHAVNMSVISQISTLSIRAIEEEYSPGQFERELEDIENTQRYYRPWQNAIGSGLACGGFCLLFGGDFTAFCYASIVALFGFVFRGFLRKKGFNIYLNICLVTFASTLTAWLTSYLSLSEWAADLPSVFHSSTPWHPLMACALFIVPGVPLINFVSDMIEGHIEVGITRAVNTLLVLVSMAFGISLAVHVCGIDNFARNLSMTPHHSFFVFAIAAAIAAVGFSMIFNVPRRLLPLVAVGGIIAVCTRNIVYLGPSNENFGLDMGLAVGSFMGSAILSIAAIWMSHRLRVPHHCLSIPSVIPMIPGVLMFRALFAIYEMQGIIGEVTVAVHNAVMASLTILCIAFGVAIPNVFFRKMLYHKDRI